MCEAEPGSGDCSCSTLQLRDLPNLGRVPWPRAKKNFFSPRVEAMLLLLLFLFLSEGAAEGGLGLALTPGSALKRKGGREVGGKGLGEIGRATSKGLWAPGGPAPMPCGQSDSQAAERKVEQASVGLCLGSF